MLKDKLNMVFSFRGMNSNGFCKMFGIKQPNYAYKAKNNRFFLFEAIQIAEYTGTKLAYIDEKGEPVAVFDASDIDMQ